MSGSAVRLRSRDLDDMVDEMVMGRNQFVHRHRACCPQASFCEYGNDSLADANLRSGR